MQRHEYEGRDGASKDRMFFTYHTGRLFMKEYSMAASIAREEGSVSKDGRSIVNSGHGEKLSRLMEDAILALLQSRTFKEAAEKVGIAESTLRSWRNDAVFREHYDASRRHLLEVGTMELADLKLEAIRVLGEELKDWSSPAIRHDAAKFVVTLPERELQRLDIERRFNTLHGKSAGKKGGDTPSLEIPDDRGTTDFPNPVSATPQEGDSGDHEAEDEPAARSAQIIVRMAVGMTSQPTGRNRTAQRRSAQIIVTTRRATMERPRNTEALGTVGHAPPRCRSSQTAITSEAVGEQRRSLWTTEARGFTARRRRSMRTRGKEVLTPSAVRQRGNRPGTRTSQGLP
jgi:hypothetical protein